MFDWKKYESTSTQLRLHIWGWMDMIQEKAGTGLIWRREGKTSLQNAIIHGLFGLYLKSTRAQLDLTPPAADLRQGRHIIASMSDAHRERVCIDGLLSVSELHTCILEKWWYSNTLAKRLKRMRRCTPIDGGAAAPHADQSAGGADSVRVKSPADACVLW